MNEKILINPKTNQEYRDVPPTVAAKYLGVALNFIYEGLKKQTLPSGKTGWRALTMTCPILRTSQIFLKILLNLLRL